MEHILKLQHIGPIQSCDIILNRFTILTGPQSNGKSTVAKAIFFFRSVKQDILDIMMQGGPQAFSGQKGTQWQYALKQRMKDKFLQLFGTSWVMPDDMEMMYAFTSKITIRVYLKRDYDYPERNFIDFDFSDSFEDYLNGLDDQIFTDLSAAQKQREEARLSKILDDPYETVFIPAGRNLITLLSAQLNYIFTSLESTQLRNIDYITKRYTELILKLKPSFSDGMLGLISDAKDDPERFIRYKKHQSAINLLMKSVEDVLKGVYRYVDGEERLYFNDRKYVKINFSSSGQQEIVWVFNLLFYYLLENKKVFLILEEPESHLYPESQQRITEILALFLNEDNAELITTHSPYILGTCNYLLLAAQYGNRQVDIKEKIHKRYWLQPDYSSAYYIHDGNMDNAMDTTDKLTLIDNGLIDGASDSINEKSDFILERSPNLE